MMIVPEKWRMADRKFNRALRPDTMILLLVGIAFIGSIVVSFFWITSLNSNKSGTAGGRLDARSEKALEDILKEAMTDDGPPGAVVGIWAPGTGNWVAARGFADAQTKEPMNTSDVFRVGSVTKTFTATVILQLADEKKLGLDDGLDKYVPSVPGAGSITIRQLLSHRSGLFDYIDDPEFRRTMDANRLTRWTPEQLVAFSSAHPPYSSPGQSFRYSSTNYVLLGMIIEKVTGQKVAREIDTRIAKPLGLTHTYLPEGPGLPAGSCKGYANSSLSEVSDIDPSGGWAASGMVSNLADLKIWARVLAEGGLVSEQMQAERLKMVATGAGEPSYGLGIIQNSNAFAPFLGHEGNIYGYSTAMFYMPEKQITVIVLLNRTPGNYDSAYWVFNRMACELFPRSY
jgi:D-alanyl-D-alanine carboxypeptidase